MILAILPAFATGFEIGILVTLAMVFIFIFGSAISNLFTCLSEMAKNTEKQTQLLEKLNEKLDK